MADMTAGQILTAGTFNSKTRKCIARARRTTNSGTSAGAATAVLRLDDKPMVGGRTYRITWIAKANSTTANDTIRGQLYHTTNGSTPTTASTNTPGGAAETSNAGNGGTLVCVTDYTPAVDETFSVLLAVLRTGGAGNASFTSNGSTLLTEIYIDDMGDDPGDTGTDL
jgi:hypothetical protein